MQDKTIAAVGSRIKNLIGYDGKESCGVNLNFLFHVVDVPISPEKTSITPGCSMIFRREIFEAEPFIPEYFGNCEDVYLSIFALFKCYRIKVNPKSFLIHKGGASVRKIPTTMDFHMEKNNLANFFILYNWLTILKLMHLFILFNLWVLFSAIFRGIFKYKIRAYIWLIKNFKLILRYKKIVNRQKKITDKELIRNYLSYKLPHGKKSTKILNNLTKIYLYIVCIKTRDM